MSDRIRDNGEAGRFELEIGGHVAFANYTRRGSTLTIPHVEAAPALRGTGAADKLMAGVMEVARAEHLKVLPLCGYAAAWMRRHKEHRDLLA